MTDFDRMTKQEIRDWAERQRRKAVAEQPPAPAPEELSRVKMHDYGRQEPQTWSFHLEHGRRAVLNRNGTMTEATVLGLRRVGDDGPLALLVQEDGRGMLALRRRYGATWGDDVDAARAEVDAVSPPVVAWEIATDTDVLPTSDVPLEELRVRTNNLLGQL